MGFAQSDMSTRQMVDMELSDLLQVKVVSASKKTETIFDAALSVSSISKEEIQNAGATSIMEALRLVPGLIVIEMTNGNYGVYLRGLSNLPLGSTLVNSTNSITLVMIDNRPVYNYFNGGTFWETLPVDLNDVESIEVVRGPSSALYGPNAAAGVINIITRKLSKDGLNVIANAQGGIPSALITNASVGYKKDKFSVNLTANLQQRQRTEDLYYVWGNGKKQPFDSVYNYISGQPMKDPNGNNNINERYPEPNLSQRKLGYNAFLNYALSEKNYLSLSLGGQESRVQKAFSDQVSTPLTTADSRTNYADAKLKLGNLNVMLADQFGTQNVALGEAGYKVDFNTIDAEAEYDLKLGSFSFRPGFNLRSATYDDSKYSDISKSLGFLNGKKTLSNIAGSLRSEYAFKDKIKLIAALRVDHYNYPQKLYGSYQFAASYKINTKNLVRFVYSRAYRGPTFYDIYNNQFLTSNNPNTRGVVQGNKDINLLQIDMFELGYRKAVNSNLQLDIDVFYQIAANYSKTLTELPVYSPDSSQKLTIQGIQNVPLKAKQFGLTLSISYTYSKFNLKPFITLQTTYLEDMSRFAVSDAVDPVNNYKNTYNTNHTGTPNVYGGFYMNYRFTPKLNANLSGYYFSQYDYTGFYVNFAANRNDGIVNIPAKFLLNTKVSYKLIKNLDVFVNLRNVLNQTSYEFAETDKVNFVALIGASFIY